MSIFSQRAASAVNSFLDNDDDQRYWVIQDQRSPKSPVPGYYVIPSTSEIPSSKTSPSYDAPSRKSGTDDIILDLETCAQKHLEALAMYEFSTARSSEDMEESSLLAIGFCRESIGNAVAWMREVKKAADILNQGWRTEKGNNDEKSEDLMRKLRRAFDHQQQQQQHIRHRYDDDDDQYEHIKMHNPKVARRDAQKDVPDKSQIPLVNVIDVTDKSRSDGITKCELTLCNPSWVDSVCHNTSRKGVLTNPRENRLCDACLSGDELAIQKECEKKQKQERNAFYLAAIVVLCIISISGAVIIAKDLSRKAMDKKQEEKTLGLRDEESTTQKPNPIGELFRKLRPSSIPKLFSRQKNSGDIENGPPGVKHNSRNKTSSDTSVPTPLRLSIGKVSSEFEGKNDFLKAASLRRASHSHGNSMDFPAIPMVKTIDSADRLTTTSRGSDSLARHSQREALKPDDVYSSPHRNGQRQRENTKSANQKGGYFNGTTKAQASVGRSSSIDSDDGEGAVEHRNRKVG